MTYFPQACQSSAKALGFVLICLPCLILGVCVLIPAPANSQLGPGTGSGENPWSENSRTPFEVHMSGFINTRPGDDNIAVVNLGISSFQGAIYAFEIIEIAAPNWPQMSTRMILQQMGRRSVDFNLIGPRHLLSKVGQAEPGTPLKIVGMFEQRRQRLTLLSVKVIGME